MSAAAIQSVKKKIFHWTIKYEILYLLFAQLFSFDFIRKFAFIAYILLLYTLIQLSNNSHLNYFIVIKKRSKFKENVFLKK